MAQAVNTFGSQHYDNYHFLFTISDNLGGIGLEHHRSSEDGADVGYFTDWKNQVPARNLLPHEYTHSWDGKFRRPAELWTPNYSDRKSVVEGKSVSVRVDLGGRRIIKKKNKKINI